jgi:hypothetical protein
MISFEPEKNRIVGPEGCILVPDDDTVTSKLFMLVEGDCLGLGPKKAAEKYGFCRQHYFEIRKDFREHGITGLIAKQRGPKTNYRRSKEVVCQAIRHRFLDPDASSDVIAQKLNQCGFQISKRSIDRIFEEYGLQKKTLQASSEP